VTTRERSKLAKQLRDILNDIDPVECCNAAMELERCRRALRIIHTWASCWSPKYEPAERAMRHIVEKCDEALGKK